MVKKGVKAKLSMLLISALLISVMGGCSKSKKSDKDTTAATTEAVTTEATTTEADTTETDVIPEMTIERIKELNGDDVVIHRNDEGRISFIGGTCTDKPIEEDGDAYLVLESMKELLGCDEDAEFDFINEFNDCFDNTYYSYMQFYRNMTIPGSQIKIVVNKDKQMIGLLSNIATEYPEGYTEGTIDPSELTEIVYKNSGYAKDDLTVYDDMTEVILHPYAYDPVVDLLNDNIDQIDSSVRYVWVVYSNNPATESTATPNDAFTEDFPFDKNACTFRAHYITFSGEYLYSIPVKEPHDAAAVSGYCSVYAFDDMEASEWKGTVTYSDGHEEELTLPVMKSSKNGKYYLGDLNRKIAVADTYDFLYSDHQVNMVSSETNDDWNNYYLITYYNIIQTWDYYNNLGWKGADGKGTPIIILKDLCFDDHVQFNNACYAGVIRGWSTFAFADCNEYGMALDAVAHEYTHAVSFGIEVFIPYMNDNGAIEEGMADILGEICQHYYYPESDASYEMGDTVISLRNMSKPHENSHPEYIWDIGYFANTDKPTSSNDRGGIHANGAVLGVIAYKLINSDSASLEDLSRFWLSAQMCRLPETDFPEYAEILTWLISNNEMDKYAAVLAEAIQYTRIKESDPPDPPKDDIAYITIKLPDKEMFKDGCWITIIESMDDEGKITSYSGNPDTDGRTIITPVPVGDCYNIKLYHRKFESSQKTQIVILEYSDTGDWNIYHSLDEIDTFNQTVVKGKNLISSEGLEALPDDLLSLLDDN